jgi:D-sedoheptulose 7-phosphate isomerase
MGMLTVALGRDDIGPIVTVDHAVMVRSSDPQIVKEMEVTIYHVLWELVHVFLEGPVMTGAAR